MRPSPMPKGVKMVPDMVPLGAGMDIATPEIMAKPGTLRLGYNYEPSIDGGIERIGGIERYDGQPAPNLAEYSLLEFEEAPTLISLGDTLTGVTSTATGVVIYIDDTLVAVTRVTDAFEAEDINVGMTLVGTVINEAADVTGPLDNHLSALAAAEYRIDIAQVPGEGSLLGLEILGTTLYAWRNNVGSTAMAIYKSTGAGWVEVDLLYEVSFTAGTSEYTEGETLTQGGVSSTVRRVALETGVWGSTAAGRFIIDAPTGGNFTAGAAVGGGACTLSGAATIITLAPDGVVKSDVSNFTSSLDRTRIYGCDGVNREFELGDDILVPLTTGMGSVRAGAVKCHKSHVFFGFRGSIQHSSIGSPYAWSAVTGATELGTGDVVNDFVPVGGSETAAALMVLCQNSLFVLYGNSSADWKLAPLSRVNGAARGTAQDAGGVIALDSPGVVRYPASQDFGNFAWDVMSRKIGSIASGQSSACSVFIPTSARYRVFFTDGTGISGLVTGARTMEFTLIDYAISVKCAVTREMDGAQRTFIADDDGWVYECDVGRSFAGETIRSAARLNSLSQRAPAVLKQYIGGEVECQAQGAMTLSVSAEFYDGDEDIAPMDATDIPVSGGGFRWDITNWDEAYWDTPGIGRKRVALEGQGAMVSVTIASESAEELPHTLRAITLACIPLRNTIF